MTKAKKVILGLLIGIPALIGAALFTAVLLIGVFAWGTHRYGKQTSQKLSVWLNEQSQGHKSDAFVFFDKPEEWRAVFSASKRSVRYMESDFGQDEFLLTLDNNDVYCIGHRHSDHTVWIIKKSR
jgi:hypothetical protein